MGMVPGYREPIESVDTRNRIESVDTRPRPMMMNCCPPCAHPPVTPEREGEGANSLHLGLRPLPILSCCLPPTPWPDREGGGSEESTARPFMSA